MAMIPGGQQQPGFDDHVIGRHKRAYVSEH
jgi:hypothetical protein